MPIRIESASLTGGGTQVRVKQLHTNKPEEV